MISDFDNFSLIHDNDLIYIDDGGKSVGDDDGGAILHQIVKRILNKSL